jgi:hypothetical protein
MIAVVVDTTETFSDPIYAAPSWAKMHLLTAKGIAVVVVPRIVRDETAAHFRDQLENAIQETNRNAGRICHLTRNPSTASVLAIDLKTTYTDYETYVDNRLNALLVLQPSYEHLDLARIAKRAVDKRKPFKESGRGFKDALIWEHVAKFAPTYEKIVLVTKNTHDFCENGDLASELKDELVALGVEKNRVVVCPSLHDAFERFGKPHIDALDGIRAAIESGESEIFDAEEFYVEAYERILVEAETWISEWRFEELGHLTRHLFEKPRLQSLNVAPTTTEVGDVFRLDAETLIIDVTYTVDAVIGCNEIEFRGDEDPPFESDFSAPAELRINNTVIVEEATGQVISHEIEYIQVEPGFKWPRDDVD